MLGGVEVPIVIVGFGNADDIVKCLTAIGEQRGCPKIGVFICENGGADAFDALIGALSKPGGLCAGEVETLDAADFLRARRLRLAGALVPVTVGLARENLGFPGGVNAWIRPLLPESGWSGVWILNPDTWPQPDALAELIDFAVQRGKGMVSSRIMFPDRSDIASCAASSSASSPPRRLASTSSPQSLRRRIPTTSSGASIRRPGSHSM